MAAGWYSPPTLGRAICDPMYMWLLLSRRHRLLWRHPSQLWL